MNKISPLLTKPEIDDEVLPQFPLDGIFKSTPSTTNTINSYLTNRMKEAYTKSTGPSLI